LIPKFKGFFLQPVANNPTSFHENHSKTFHIILLVTWLHGK